jgi:hypothetical protein
MNHHARSWIASSAACAILMGIAWGCSSSEDAQVAGPGGSATAGTGGASGGTGGTTSTGGTSGTAGAAGTGGLAGTSGSDAAAGQPGDASIQDGPVSDGAIAVPASCFAGAASCNPLTNAGCTELGAGCDTSYGGTNDIQQLKCYPSEIGNPNIAKIGEYCNFITGPFCLPGLHCEEVSKACRTFCCSKADCQGSEVCLAIPGTAGGSLGVCVVPHADGG